MAFKSNSHEIQRYGNGERVTWHIRRLNSSKQGIISGLSISDMVRCVRCDKIQIISLLASGHPMEL